MKETVFYHQQPEPMLYMWPSGAKVASVWLRKGIKKKTMEPGLYPEEYWCAEEVYLETTASKGKVEKDFDKFYEIGESWAPKNPQQKKTTEQTIAELKEQLEATMGALDYLLMQGEV